MAEVIFNKLEKVYSNGFKAVHGIDLKIADGEFMVIVGPSGCAKSTTLRMLAGLETISGGEVRIGDKIVNNLAPKSRGIAMVFQNYALYPHMTVRENLAFGLKLSKLPKAQIDRQVEEAAKILELEELLDRLPRQLSGGQAQRVAVGRAIVKKPDVFLFDEPLSNLDAKLRASMRIRISDLHKQLKKSGKPATTVYVTHDQTEAMTMGDRICVMKLGHIMQVDTPDNLYHQPKNMFVAGFIGAPEMNIRPSQLVEHDGRLHLTLGDQRLPLNDLLQSKVETHKNQQVFFGVRPEFVSLSDEPFAEGSCTGEMVRVENMGHEFFVYLKVADYELTARVFYFNDEAWKKAGIAFPKTWDELMAAGKTFESKLGKQYYPVVLEHQDVLALLNSYMVQKYNQPAIDEKGRKFSYSKAQWADFFGMYKKLIDNHVMPDTRYYASFGKSNMYEMKPWIQGEWGGTYMWNSTINKYSDNLKPPAKLVLGEYPMLPGATDAGLFFKPAQMLSIGKSTKNPQAAAKVINFLLNSKEGVDILGLERGVPLSKAAVTYLTEDGIIKADDPAVSGLKLAQSLPTALPVSPYFDDPQIVAQFVTTLQYIDYGKKSVEEAAEDFQRQTDRILRRAMR